MTTLKTTSPKKHSVKIGPEFFAKARNDYSNWTWAIVREFFQNCIDCGSTEIELTVVEEGGKTTLTVANNGEPMTQDVIVDKLLSLGSSGKGFEGSVGGFGKAKELLYFCWDSYRIHSGGYQVDGSGAEYTIRKVKQNAGTTSTIVIDGLWAPRLLAQARFFVECSNVRPTFVLNGEQAMGKMRKGYFRRDLSAGKVYTNRQLQHTLVVRIGGTPMHTMWTKYKDCVVIELEGISSDAMTSNRDGLKALYRVEVEGFIGDLTTNKRKALRQPVTEYIRFKGNALSSTAIGMARHALKDASTTLKEKVEAVTEEGPNISLQEGDEGMAIDGSTVLGTGEYGHREVRELEAHRASELAMAFVIKNETGRVVPKDWRPDSDKFSKHAYKMATIWARLMTVMHRIFEADEEFTIGFIFSDHCLAQYELTPEHGKCYFINPVKYVDGRWNKRYNYSPSAGRFDLNQIAISALHELVHGMGYSDHDEDYAGKLTDMSGVLLNHTSDLIWCYKQK